MTTRREFLPVLACSGSGPPSRRSSAAPPSPPPAAGKPGAEGHRPRRGPAHRRQRRAEHRHPVRGRRTTTSSGRRIAVPKDQVKKLTDDARPAPGDGRRWRSCYNDDAALCVVQGVGYPNPSQSHFRSMDVWQAGEHRRDAHRGLARQGAQAAAGAPAFHLAAGGNEAAPLALAGAPVRVPSITSLDDFQLKTAAASGADKDRQKRRDRRARRKPRARPARRTCSTSSRARRRTPTPAATACGEVGKNYQPKAPYPHTGAGQPAEAGGPAHRRRASGPGCSTSSLDGFDTHAGQGGAAGRTPTCCGRCPDAIAGVLQRPRRPRARRPGVRDDVLRVRPPRRRRTAARAPTTAPARRCSWSAAG